METATIGLEFVGARTAVDQVIDINLTLMYLGLPINPKSCMFGDNRQWSPMPPSLLSLSPRYPILLPTTEFKKQLQQALSSSI